MHNNYQALQYAHLHKTTTMQFLSGFSYNTECNSHRILACGHTSRRDMKRWEPNTSIDHCFAPHLLNPFHPLLFPFRCPHACIRVCIYVRYISCLNTRWLRGSVCFSLDMSTFSYMLTCSCPVISKNLRQLGIIRGKGIWKQTTQLQYHYNIPYKSRSTWDWKVIHDKKAPASTSKLRSAAFIVPPSSFSCSCCLEPAGPLEFFSLSGILNVQSSFTDLWSHCQDRSYGKQGKHFIIHPRGDCHWTYIYSYISVSIPLDGMTTLLNPFPTHLHYNHNDHIRYYWVSCYYHHKEERRHAILMC